MAKFIELPLIDGQMVCINANYIEEIRSIDDNTCIIYMAFNVPDAVDQDTIKVNMPYGAVVSHLLMMFG